MKVDFDLHDEIYVTIELEAKELGLTPAEVLRRLIGVHCLEMRRVFTPPTPPSIPMIALTPQFQMRPRDKAINMASNLMVQQLIARGEIKCPNCTLPLSMKSLEAGECESCKTKLGVEEGG